jgi:G3E family GTPase
VVVLETSGIAEPDAIVRGLDDWASEATAPHGSDAPARAPVCIASIVTVVDAEVGVHQLDRHIEARAQVTAADRILLSKVDLADAAGLLAVHRRLHEMNPAAERAAFPPGDAGAAALVPWLLDARAPEIRRGRGHDDHREDHAHGHQLAAATYVDDAPLLGEALLLVCAALGDRLVRAKGFVRLAGEPRRGFLERAGDHTRLELGAPWGDDPPITRLVLIGEGLDEAALHRQLWACRAG